MYGCRLAQVEGSSFPENGERMRKCRANGERGEGRENEKIEREKMERMGKWRERDIYSLSMSFLSCHCISIFSFSISISSFSLHLLSLYFLILSLSPLHFLILSPFSLSPFPYFLSIFSQLARKPRNLCQPGSWNRKNKWAAQGGKHLVCMSYNPTVGTMTTLHLKNIDFLWKAPSPPSIALFASLGASLGNRTSLALIWGSRLTRSSCWHPANLCLNIHNTHSRKTHTNTNTNWCVGLGLQFLLISCLSMSQHIGIRTYKGTIEFLPFVRPWFYNTAGKRERRLYLSAWAP